MYIKSELKDQAYYIYLDRQAKKNALNMEMVSELINQINIANKMDNVKVIVLTGYGNNFSAGADIEMLASFDSNSALEFRKSMNSLSRLIRSIEKPVISILKGYSLGGGLEIAESTDIRIALDNAIIGQPEISIGINAGAGGNVILPRIVGSGRAMYMAMSGKKFNAQDAMALGLVDEIAGSENDAEKIVSEISSKPSITLSYIKKLVNSSIDMPLDNAMDLEALYFSMLFNSDEVKNILSKWKK